MKAVHSEAYYRQYWNDFMKPTVGERYMNLERDLNREMSVYEGIVAEEYLTKIRKIKAQKIASDCKAVLLEDMQVIKQVEAGEASFGMTTYRQEFEVRARFERRFEFNCLQLADFRKKYELS